MQTTTVEKTGTPDGSKGGKWGRILIGAGFVILLVGLGVGKATHGSPVAQYLGIGGVSLLGAGVLVAAASAIFSKMRGGAVVSDSK